MLKQLTEIRRARSRSAKAGVNETIQVFVRIRPLKECADCIYGYQNRPCRDCHDDGKEQRFNSELQSLFSEEIRSGKFAKRSAFPHRQSFARVCLSNCSLHGDRSHNWTLVKAEVRSVRLRIVKTRLRLGKAGRSDDRKN